MYSLQKVFPVYIVLLVLLFLLFTGCEGKKENPDSVTTQSETETFEASSTQEQKDGTKVSKAGLPKLIDLGADKCIPCKMMAPILEELKSEYAGKLEVIFIDVWKDPGAGRQYGIRVIPTQIFYDADGKEFHRHVGFLSKEGILAVFKEKGINFNES